MRLSPLSVSVADYLFFREARSNAAKGKYFADDRLVSADKFAGGQTASKVGIFGEGGQFARERRGRKIAFAQDAAQAFLLKIRSVFHLVAAGTPVFERYKQGGLFECQDLKYRIGTCTGENDVGTGIRRRHVLFVCEGKISWLPRRAFFLSPQMQNIELRQETGQCAFERAVDRLTAASAAEGEKDGLSARKAVFCEGGGAVGEEEFFPHGRTAVFAVFQSLRRFGKAGKHRFAFARDESVCEPCRKVAFVRKNGYIQRGRREYDGQCDIASFGKDGGGRDLAEGTLCLAHARKKAEWKGEIRKQGATYELRGGDGIKWHFFAVKEAAFDAVGADII